MESDGVEEKSRDVKAGARIRRDVKAGAHIGRDVKAGAHIGRDVKAGARIGRELTIPDAHYMCVLARWFLAMRVIGVT
ncbi:hypothetical protein ElyMa_002915600 [Elysia marginata]|uniref:Dynactin subunit 6 n=1 Tax=Elysia marginata TaxID=1093978 RepID=A0AAV4I4S2_9GAST|nr:hypothetical protein ElyMa_002915600 [Elysia marginata]